ncbi:hypothetical protein [Streptomyces sp. NBC_00425]|uniref:hypothetical protein n=1 Tax=Streptomyces sp. NBC_00425 TaxID=2975740 RepID=UPI002E2174F4
MDAFVSIGVGACYAGSGALALAALRSGRAGVPAGAPARRLHVSEVEQVPVSPGTGRLEVIDSYAPYDTAEYHYCPAEFRVTAHAVQADGTLSCWHCEPLGEA